MSGFDLFTIFFVYLYAGMLVAIMYDCDCIRTGEERRRPLYQIAFQAFRKYFFGK